MVILIGLVGQLDMLKTIHQKKLYLQLEQQTLVMLLQAIVMNVEVFQIGAIILFMPQEMLFIQRHMMEVMEIRVGHQWRHHMLQEQQDCFSRNFLIYLHLKLQH